MKRGVRYIPIAVELDPLLLNGIKRLAAQRSTSMSVAIRDAIYTAIYGAFRGCVDMRSAPIPLRDGMDVPGAAQVRVIDGGFYEVDGSCLPLTDEPLQLRAIRA